MDKGLYGKYVITKANGEPTDPDAQYFVLRIDTDKHARKALRTYADSLVEEANSMVIVEEAVGQFKFATELRNWLRYIPYKLKEE